MTLLCTFATEGSATNQGRKLYMTFHVFVQLTKIIPQSGYDELQIKFRDALQRLRDGCPSYDDWHQLYMSRNFARHEQLGDVKTSFRDAVRLFACRDADITSCWGYEDNKLPPMGKEAVSTK